MAKFVVTFKTPDAVDDAASDVARGEFHESKEESYDRHEEKERVEELKKFTEKWVEYGEYVRIEFDTDKGTATVLTLR